MPANSIPITQCLLCQGSTTLVLPLAATPPANELSEIHNPTPELYPLNLMKCQECQHLQLDTEISKFRLFRDYVYTANTSSSNYNYFYDYASEMKKLFDPSFVVDIGSNDGLLLGFMQKQGAKVLGIEPAANIAQIAKDNGVETLNNYFNDQLATDILGRHGWADLITANNVMAHNSNLDPMFEGIRILLAHKGTFIMEVAYGMTMLKDNLFDLLYHEHIHSWTLQALVKYLAKFDLAVYDAEIVNTHGGSLRCYIQHLDEFKGMSENSENLLKTELQEFDLYLKQFKTQVPKLKKKLIKILKEIKSNNKTVAILGYPAKACTLSYYFELDQYITEVYDNNPLKIGKYTHQGIKISPEQHIYKNKPDYLLVLSWNYLDELQERHKLFLKSGGKFITPFPQPRIL